MVGDLCLFCFQELPFEGGVGEVSCWWGSLHDARRWNEQSDGARIVRHVRRQGKEAREGYQ